MPKSPQARPTASLQHRRSEAEVMNTKELAGPPQEKSNSSLRLWRGKEKVSPPTRSTGIVMSEGKHISQGNMREPVVVMKRPDFINMKQKSVTSIDFSSSSLETTEWGAKQKSVSSSADSFSFSGTTERVPSKGSMGLKASKPFHFQGKGKGKQSDITSSSSFEPSLILRKLPQLSLFYGWSSLGKSHPKKWSNTNPPFDYERIDWTLEAHLMPPKRLPSSRMSTGISSSMHTLRSASTKASSSSSSSSSACLWEWNSLIARSDLIWLQEVWSSAGAAASSTSSAGLCEWTSPFAGRDLFNVPQKYVTTL